MVQYTLEQRWEILRYYFENHCVRILKEEKHRQHVRYLMKKVQETGILIDKSMKATKA